MNKIYKFIAAGVITIASVASCDSILDKSQLDAFEDNNFWSGEGNVESYANTFFNEFVGYGNGGGSGSFYFPTLNDNQAGSSFRDWNYSNYMVTNGSWTGGYESVRRANIMINRVEGMTALSDAQKKHWVGVARLMRALEYYWLVRQFGDVPLISTEMKTNSPELYGAREDRDKVMDFVLEDLNAAVAGITSKSKVSWSTDLANAIKSEICLYEGTFCKYRSVADKQKAPDEARAKKFLEECKTASAAIMGNSAYKLSDDYNSNYNSIDLKANTEMILYKHYVKDLMHHSLVDYTCSSTEMSGMNKDAFDSYLFIDGLPKSATAKDKSDKGVLDGKIVNISNLLSVRDPRLGKVIDDKLGYTSNEGFKRYTDRKDGMLMTSSTGYTVCKFDTKALDMGYRDQTTKNYTDAPIYWLSVIYLNYAEACAELGSCTQNDLNISVNKLRARVGMPNMTVSPVADAANNMNVSNLIWEIRRERRVELMFDNDTRFWDLIRWHQLDKLDSSKNPNILLGANVSVDTALDTKATAKKGDYIDASRNGVRKYEAKYYLYPIPTSQILLNKKLSQNPGWEE